MKLTPLQIAVTAILDRAEAFEWSVQGLGILRLHIRDFGRIHIWDSHLRVEGVSNIHTHPWDLTSTIVFGQMKNIRHREHTTWGLPFWRKRILCGYNFKQLSEPEPVKLTSNSPEFYKTGDSYFQTANEIHETVPTDGTITLMQRRQEQGEGEAFVYWPLSQEYGNAKPRPATTSEIRDTVWRAKAKATL